MINLNNSNDRCNIVIEIQCSFPVFELLSSVHHITVRGKSTRLVIRCNCLDEIK